MINNVSAADGLPPVADEPGCHRPLHLLRRDSIQHNHLLEVNHVYTRMSWPEALKEIFNNGIFVSPSKLSKFTLDGITFAQLKISSTSHFSDI